MKQNALLHSGRFLRQVGSTRHYYTTYTTFLFFLLNYFSRLHTLGGENLVEFVGSPYYLGRFLLHCDVPRCAGAANESGGGDGGIVEAGRHGQVVPGGGDSVSRPERLHQGRAVCARDVNPAPDRGALPLRGRRV